MRRLTAFFSRFWTIATLVYVASAILWLAPTSLNPAHRLLEGRNDATLTLTQWRGEAYLGQNPWTARSNKMIAAPEGVPLPRSVNYLSPIEPAFNWTFRYVVGWVFAFNLYLFFGLVGSALAFAFLMRRVGLSPPVALVGGYLFAFDPWMMAHARLGDDFQPWILALLLAACLGVSRRRTTVAAALVGLCVGVGFLTHPYMGLLAIFVAGVYLIYELVRLG